MTHDHHHSANSAPQGDSCEHCTPKRHIDWLMWISAVILVLTYVSTLLLPDFILPIRYFGEFAASTVELLNRMWWGMLLGIISVGLLGAVPRELIMGLLGKGGTFSGILRATIGGVLLDLCSHGILLVGMKLYERGASTGQTIAFLIASPWNSLSLTLILWSLVGFQWMFTFLVLSMVIGIVSGLVIDQFTERGVLPKNPNAHNLPENYQFWTELKKYLISRKPSLRSTGTMFVNGLKDSEMVLRWIFFGVVLASLIRATVPIHFFEAAFGPTMIGLLATLVFATVLEVCSEGSLPVATDILLRAKAAGNSFAFLMTGVSTDYTEILILRETTKSWKVALFLPLVTVPQVIFVAMILNGIRV